MRVQSWSSVDSLSFQQSLGGLHCFWEQLNLIFKDNLKVTYTEIGGHFLCAFVCLSEVYVGGGQMTTSDIGFHLPPCLRQSLFIVWSSINQMSWPESELWILLSLPTILKHEYWDYRCMLIWPDLCGFWGFKLRSSHIHSKPSPHSWGSYLSLRKKKVGVYWYRSIDRELNEIICLRWGS